VYFALGSAEPAAQRAVAGWGGDRLYAYRSTQGKIAIVWLTSWDDEQQAAEAEQAAARTLSAAPAAERTQQLVARAGRALLVLRSVPSELHAEVRDHFDQWAKSLAASARGNGSVGQGRMD
jgi:hypothetical protein